MESLTIKRYKKSIKVDMIEINGHHFKFDKFDSLMRQIMAVTPWSSTLKAESPELEEVLVYSNIVNLNAIGGLFPGTQFQIFCKIWNEIRISN